MDAAKRIHLSRIAEKIYKNKKYAHKIGTNDNSKFEEKRGGFKC